MLVARKYQVDGAGALEYSWRSEKLGNEGASSMRTAAMIQFTEIASTAAHTPTTSCDGWAVADWPAASPTVFAVRPASLACSAGRSAGVTATKFPYAQSGVRKEPVLGRVFMSLPLGGCIRETQQHISIRCFSSEVTTDPGREARWR